MKRIQLLAALCGLWAGGLFAQINDGGSQPLSFEAAALRQTAVPTVSAPPFPHERARVEDAEQDARGGMYRFGRVLPVQVSLHNSGTWQTLPSGDRVWRVRLASSEAKAISLYFNRFKLPEGARLHVYNDDRSQLIGGFGAHNNHASGLFATQSIAGEAVILEYFEPVFVQGQGELEIDGVGHTYRSISDFGDAQTCQVNVNCSEGSGKTDQRNAVARIEIKVGSFLGWCSGALINNVRQDCTPYFLTALHCALDGSTAASVADLNQWIFHFNYQASSCANPTNEPSSNTLTGATRRADSNDNGGDTGSDFLLLELNSTPPSNYNAYYAGWDRSTSAPTSGYGIHHPSGDIKKISTFTSAASSSTWATVAGTHWELSWVSTTNGDGTTEGGSSGSPLFNSNGNIVGTLTGGSSDCNDMTLTDLYGKVAYHWISNGTANNRRLSPWLDPDGVGSTSISGTYSPCLSSVESVAQTAFSVFPNPTSGQFSVQMAAPVEGSLQLVDALGRVLQRVEIQPYQLQMDLNLATQPNGMYFVVLQTTRETQIQRIVLARP